MVDRAATLELRETTDADLPQILKLLESSLGWVPDQQYGAFYRWMHHDAGLLEKLLAALRDDRIRTNLSVEVLRRPYGFAPLHYHGIRDGGGLVLFRLRRRGPATEYVVGYLLLLGGGPVLTLRELAESGMPPLDEWELTSGDIEIF